MMRRVSTIQGSIPAHPSDHPIFGKLDNVCFSTRKSFVIGDPTLQIMAIENMPLCGRKKIEEMEMIENEVKLRVCATKKRIWKYLFK